MRWELTQPIVEGLDWAFVDDINWWLSQGKIVVLSHDIFGDVIAEGFATLSEAIEQCSGDR